jgi:hypothetical protein
MGKNAFQAASRRFKSGFLNKRNQNTLLKILCQKAAESTASPADSAAGA